MGYEQSDSETQDGMRDDAESKITASSMGSFS